MFGYYKSNCAGSTARTSLANFSWRFYTIWQHQANTLLAQMPFQREARRYAYIFTPVRLPVVGTSTCKYIYPRCWFLKACGPQHTSLLWNIQFGDCKEIRLVNSFLRSHETQCRGEVQSLWYEICLEVLMAWNECMALPRWSTTWMIWI